MYLRWEAPTVGCSETWELGQNPVSAGTFRAIAPLIGLPHEGFLDGKGKAGDLPVILMTGMRDKTVPPGQWGDSTATESYDGGKGYFYESATGNHNEVVGRPWMWRAGRAQNTEKEKIWPQQGKRLQMQVVV